MYLKQLGYTDDNLPTLYILYTTTQNPYRFELAMLVDPDIPFWTGDDFLAYVKKHYDTIYDYTIEQNLLKGTRCLWELGLRPNVVNIAVPVVKYQCTLIKAQNNALESQAIYTLDGRTLGSNWDEGYGKLYHSNK